MKAYILSEIHGTVQKGNEKKMTKQELIEKDFPVLIWDSGCRRSSTKLCGDMIPEGNYQPNRTGIIVIWRERPNQGYLGPSQVSYHLDVYTREKV